MLRIGLVTGEYPPHQGGVGDFSREIARALAALGHDVHVITHTSARSNDRNDDRSDDFSRLSATATTHPAVHPLIRSWNLQSLILIRRLVRSLSLDLLNIQYQAAAYDMTPPIHFLPSLAGRPSVVTFHDLRIPYLFPKAGPLRPAAVAHLARSASGVIVTNPEDHQTLQRDSKIKCLAEIPIGSNIAPREFHNGLANTRYRRQWGLSQTEAVVGYFGFLNASKGGETLFHALAQLPNYQLLLIGGRTGASDPTNEKYAAELDALADSLSLAGRIIRTGYLPPAETTQAFLACDLMAMPYVDGASFRRGTFMACLAHGMPTITTQPSTPLPQLRDGENIRLVPPEDPTALAAAIRELAADPALRSRLSTGALALAEGFRWDKIAAQTAAFFEIVLASR